MDYKYEIGDWVRIRSAEAIGPSWDFDEESMSKYCGKVATVMKRRKGRTKIFYDLSVDDGRYYWSEDMLAPANGCRLLADVIENAPPEKEDDRYEIDFDHGSFVWGLFEAIKDSGLGKIIGNMQFNFMDDTLELSADLEGDRELVMHIRRK